MIKRKLSASKLKKVANILKIISHPVKLEILEILEQFIELDVTTIREKLKMKCEISMLSHHLNKMKDNGILMSDKKGKQVFYSISDRNILKIFECMENCSLV